jgi:hypothetical protein
VKTTSEEADVSDSQVRKTDGAVLTCTVSDCGYNRSLKCFAPSIAVGDDHPYCDTYTHDTVPAAESEAFVSQCLTMMCDFNDAGHCSARGVTLDCHSGHADCATFRA